MKDASKREDAYNQRFTLLQMHALRRVGPSPGVQALSKSEIEMGYVSQQNWDEKDMERPGIPIIAWLWEVHLNWDEKEMERPGIRPGFESST